MSYITSFETLENAIKMAGGKPKVLEALWDGDTNGWFIVLRLYIETGTLLWIKEEIKQIGIVSFGGDIRLFTGEVPAWPEAVLTKEWGQKIREKYGIIFYFPSDKEPDDDCPGWHQRHLAINCADCNKLIIPTTSPYLPKDVCYNCHLKRDENEKIRTAKPYDDGVTMYLSKNNEYERLGYCTYFKSFTIAPFINDLVQARLTDKAINIVTLDQQDIAALKVKLQQALEAKLADYKMPVIDERMKSFISIYTVEYKGNKYDLMNKLNDDHAEISELMYSLDTAERAFSENYNYKIFFKKGITYRDDTVLRFVNYVSKGTATIAAINKRYTNVLTEEDVMATLKKLEQIGCITMQETEVKITEVGKKLE